MTPVSGVGQRNVSLLQIVLRLFVCPLGQFGKVEGIQLVERFPVT